MLGLLARGVFNRAIANRLVISPKTVSNYVEHIYTKIGSSTRAVAALFAAQHGLLTEQEADSARHAATLSAPRRVAQAVLISRQRRR